MSKNAYPPRDHGSCSQLTDDHAITSLFFKLSQDSSRAIREGPSASSIARVAALAPPPASSVRMDPRCSSFPSKTAPMGNGVPNPQGVPGLRHDARSNCSAVFVASPYLTAVTACR